MHDTRSKLNSISFRAVEMLEGMIAVMEAAAEQVSLGRPPDQVAVGSHQLYVASADEGQTAVISVLTMEEYFGLLSSAAEEMGLFLDGEADLEVRLPEAEFGENMVTGGFEEFRGIGVELRSSHLEELLDLVCVRLKGRGLSVSCAGEDVIFCLQICRGQE